MIFIEIKIFIRINENYPYNLKKNTYKNFSFYLFSLSKTALVLKKLG